MTVVGNGQGADFVRPIRRRQRVRLPWLTAAGLLLYGCGRAVAGGGGSTQTVPDSVLAGEPATVELHLSVIGNNAHIEGQYSNVALFHRLVGASDFQRVDPSRHVAVDDRHETYVFTIPPAPAGSTGSIELYFTATLSGQTTRIPGMKQIRIE
jgi:hypothetical protein